MKTIIFYCAVLTGLALMNVASGAELAEAKITAVVHDVKLLRGQAVLRPATVNDEIRQDTAVRTGLESRSELTFPDLTIARLGANTIFSFNQEAREVRLINGAILLRVPKNSGGAKITTDAVTAGIVGTTVMMEFHPHGIAKFIVLEGVARLYLKNRLGESILVHAGEMMIVRSGATHLDDPVDVDISQIMRTSLLIIGFGPLPSDPLIASAESKQMQMKSEGELIETNAVIYGSGTLITLTDETDLRFAVLPAATKFGKPETITTPNPFPITSATQINTDPTVKTGKITASGKIYRGPAEDGPLSKYLFDSTSSFDKALKFDTELFADPNNLPVPFFKFQNLTLLGNPTITIGQNGVTKLGLVGVDGITSGPPGGNLTFNGLDLLVLATQAGSIDLTSDLSFQNLKTLVIYARGAGSNLSLASPISATVELSLFAEANIQVSSVDASLTAERVKLFAADSITLNGGVMSATATNSDGRVVISAGNDISITNGLEIDRKFGGQSSGLNVTLTSGANLTAGNTGAVNIDNSVNGSLADGANITLDVGGDVTINRSGALSLLIANNEGGHIGNGGNIFVATGGNLTAGSIDAFINNRNGGSIGSGANMTFSIGGALKTTGDARFLISNRFDTTAGGTIGSDVTVSLNAASVSIGGVLDPAISNRGATIGGSATIALMISGDLEAAFGTGPVQNGFFTITNGVITGSAGGMIRSDAAIEIKAANISAPGMPFEAGIGNNNGFNGFISPAGGSIGRDATINVNAANLDAGSLGFDIANGNGGIQGTVGGAIGNDATISVNATDITTGSNLDVGINNAGGRIGGNATINMNISGTATVASDATVQILGSNGAASAAININGGNYNAGGTFLGFIDGSGMFALNNANIAADVIKVGVFGNNGTLRIGGGSISANTLMQLYAPGSNGIIDFVSNVTLRTSNAIPTIAANTVTIENGVVVTINAQPDGVPFPADVFTNVPNYSGSGGNGTTTGTFAGNGARTQSLGQAPPFATKRSNSNIVTSIAAVVPALKTGSAPVPAKRPTLRVVDTPQLQSLLDTAARGIDGKVHISPDTHRRNAAMQTSAGAINPRKDARRSVAKAPSGMLVVKSP